MRDHLFFVLLAFALVAALLRASFILTLIYLLLGVYLLGQWWGRRAVEAVAIRRDHPSHAFFGETIPVQLDIRNIAWAPVVWLQIHESQPVELSGPARLDRVITLGAHARTRLEYSLQANKRGYYEIGPLRMVSGDLFGIAEPVKRIDSPGYLTVFPRIVPLTQLSIPSSSPFGALRHTQPIYEDPSRVLGKRDYQSGDSLRRIDWKATATSGRLQVKLFEPSIALETAIFLNLNTREYDPRSRFDSTELAIIVAASLASWIISKRQSAGLFSNGTDPLFQAVPAPIPVRRGRAHLLRLLEVLARIQAAETTSFAELLRQQSHHLGWGTTLLILTPNLDTELFDSLFQTRRLGLNPMLIPCGRLSGLAEIRRRADAFGFPLHPILSVKDLEAWRQ